ncbi:MAG TPA: hypothetical protein V6C81_25830 [Planktothrix sp.]|jgi:hypothetical protein
MTRTPKQQVKHFLKTGHCDVLPLGWPGDWISAAKNADHAMRDALIAQVRDRAQGLPVPKAPVVDFRAFTRNKVSPMVVGLFRDSERANVLEMLENSVVFLAGDNIEDVIRHTRWAHTAWTLANLYLLSIGAELMSASAPRLVGLSEETTCYVSHDYFDNEERFADFVVHEVAHVFHNCKRATVGLPETRTKEFLLNIDFHQRETFAYACEVYSRILELAETRKQRMALLEAVCTDFVVPDQNADIEKFRAAVSAAVRARNGWNKILQICAPKL